MLSHRIAMVRSGKTMVGNCINHGKIMVRCDWYEMVMVRKVRNSLDLPAGDQPTKTSGVALQEKMFSRSVRKLLRTHNIQVACMARSRRRPPEEAVVAVQDRIDSDIILSDDEREIYLDEIADILSPNRTPNTSVPQHKKKSNKQLESEFLKQKIIKSKERKLLLPKEPLLLTWAARRQVKYLYHMDRSYWTPVMLANSFPVSPDLMRKLVRSVHIPRNMSRIIDHDKEVYQKWLDLKSILELEGEEKERQMDEDMKWAERCARRYLHLLPFAAGNTSLPLPPDDYVYLTDEKIKEEKKPVVRPYFSLILTENEKKLKSSKEEIANKESPIGFNDNSVRLLLEGIAELGQNQETSQRFDIVTNLNSEREVPFFGTRGYEVRDSNESSKIHKFDTRRQPAEFQRHARLPQFYRKNTKNTDWREIEDKTDRNFMEISLHHEKQRKG